MARPEFGHASPHQIVPRLADRGESRAAESAVDRVLKTHDLLAQRGRAIPAHWARPRTRFRGEITYVLRQIRGQYLYWSLCVEICSRQAVGADVHAEESRAHASRVLDTICRAAGIVPQPVSVHADTGGARNGATRLAPMPRRGIVPSFSRPSVRNDHPVSASLFRTLQYCPS